MPTSFPIPLPHAPTGFVNQAALDTAFTTPINDLAAQSSLGYFGDNANAATTTLATAATNVAASSAITFTLTTTRRVNIRVECQFSMLTGTNAQYFLQAAYNTGASVVIGSAVTIGSIGCAVMTVTGLRQSATAQGTVLLPAGTYTAYCAVQRASGGGATDLARSNYVAIYDAGST